VKQRFLVKDGSGRAVGLLDMADLVRALAPTAGAGSEARRSA
jgi:hypothetical protein